MGRPGPMKAWIVGSKRASAPSLRVDIRPQIVKSKKQKWRKKSRH
jgi:hypothetical protein